MMLPTSDYTSRTFQSDDAPLLLLDLIVRAYVFDFVTHSTFDLTIMSCIILNILSMCVTFYGESESWTFALDICNYIFTSIFFIEMILKLYGLGIYSYFKDNWNRFDFSIVLGSIVEVVFDIFGSLLNVRISMVRVLRIFRVSRLLRLVKAAESLQTLLKTLLVSLPSLANVGTLLGLMYFVYAVLAVKLFGTVEYGECLNVHANFEVLQPPFSTWLTIISTRVEYDDLTFCIILGLPNCRPHHVPRIDW